MAVFHNHTCVAAGEGRRKMAVSLDFYKTFYYAAKYGSFTEAAKALYVTQPTVTHAISCLERELGCALFVRSRKGAALTPEGSLLYEHVRSAFDHLQEAEKTLQDRKALLSGQVRIGASETTLHFFLLPCLRNYRRLYPGVRLKVSNGTTPQALAALREGAIDCAILVMRRDYRSILQPQDLMRVVALADFQHGLQYAAGLCRLRSSLPDRSGGLGLDPIYAEHPVTGNVATMREGLSGAPPFLCRNLEDWLPRAREYGILGWLCRKRHGF